MKTLAKKCLRPGAVRDTWVYLLPDVDFTCCNSLCREFVSRNDGGDSGASPASTSDPTTHVDTTRTNDAKRGFIAGLSL
jgi:hypothetical protein